MSDKVNVVFRAVNRDTHDYDSSSDFEETSHFFDDLYEDILDESTLEISINGEPFEPARVPTTN